MRTYDELVNLARMCAHNARLTTSNAVATELWRMAQEYQLQAANLDEGKLPDIGPSPVSRRMD